jgi:hypothetical protein
VSKTPAYQFDDVPEGEENPEATIVNISDEPIRVEIGQGPGARARVYQLAPYGENGHRTTIQRGYTQPYRGAGRGMVTPTIERMTEREIVHAIPPKNDDPGRRAVRVPFVVHEDREDEARDAYKAAIELGESLPDVRGRLARQRDERIKAAGARERRAQANAPRKPAPREDIEDQAGQLDEPPPDDDMPLASEAPALYTPEPVTIPPPPSKGKRS